MKQFIIRAFVALIVFSGVMSITQTSSAAAPGYAPYPVYPSNYYGFNPDMIVNPAIGHQAPQHPLTPTQMRTGYTRNEIRSMPMVSRPNRPGHFIGNTVRRRAGTGY